MPANLSDWLDHISRLHAQPIALGLDRVRQVQSRMPATDSGVLPVIITVGGTNGKGSTCAMLERILLRAGYRVGLYTSPHLLHYNERVRIQAVPVEDAQLCAGFEQVEAAREATALTYFEFGTLAAWAVFQAAELDVIILEVGLGGRLDAVNIFDPDVAIVTTVGIDHTEFLGDTREAIGFEKAGIFRAGRPAICGDANPPESLVQHAREIGARLECLGQTFGYQAEHGQWHFWQQSAAAPETSVKRGGLAYPALRGNYQLANASCVMAALNAINERLPVSMQAIREGLAEVELPGRFQVLPGRPTVILDVAHNPQAAGVLAATLKDMGSHTRNWAVFGMLDDKDIDGVIDQFAGVFEGWYVANLPPPRGAKACDLAGRLHGRGETVSGEYETPTEAYRAAQNQVGENDRIAVFGSFLTVSDVMAHLKTASGR